MRARRTQYTAGSFAQPIRRVFGSVVFRAREHVAMPKPGDTAVARLRVELRDTVWDSLYAPIIRLVGGHGRALNRMQFLTIRNYLTLVFAALVALLIIVGPGDELRLAHPARSKTALVLALAPLLSGVTRKIRARLLRRQGPSVLQPLSRPAETDPQGNRHRRERILAVSCRPLPDPRTTWVAAALVPTFATGLSSLDAARRYHRHRGAPRNRALPARARRTPTSARASAAIGASREMLFASLAEPANADGGLHAVAVCRLDATVVDFGLHAGTRLQCQHFTRPRPGGADHRLIGENARIPVDNPATHLELTMVHEAMILEYSGRHLAVIEAAAAVKLLLYLSLIACVFTPWGTAVAGAGALAYAIGLIAWAIKLAALAFLLVVFETAIAKMRVFRVPEFLGIALMLGCSPRYCCSSRRSRDESAGQRYCPSTRGLHGPLELPAAVSGPDVRPAQRVSRCMPVRWRARSPGRPICSARRICSSRR